MKTTTQATTQKLFTFGAAEELALAARRAVRRVRQLTAKQQAARRHQANLSSQTWAAGLTWLAGELARQ